MTKAIDTPVKPFRLSDEFISRHALAREMNKTVRSLQMWEKKRLGPASIHIGVTAYYSLETVRSWLRDQEKHGWPDIPKAADSPNGEA